MCQIKETNKMRVLRSSCKCNFTKEETTTIGKYKWGGTLFHFISTGILEPHKQKSHQILDLFWVAALGLMQKHLSKNDLLLTSVYRNIKGTFIFHFKQIAIWTSLFSCRRKNQRNDQRKISWGREKNKQQTNGRHSFVLVFVYNVTWKQYVKWEYYDI